MPQIFKSLATGLVSVADARYSVVDDLDGTNASGDPERSLATSAFPKAAAK